MATLGQAEMHEGRERRKSNGLYSALYLNFTSNVKTAFALTRRYLLGQLEMRISEKTKQQPQNKAKPRKHFFVSEKPLI